MTKINKEGWEIKSFEKIVMKLPKAKQVKTDAYNSGSKYPIISQEETYISGYCDDESMLFRIDRPVVIFGDHTRVLKYVDFDFVVGADGVKIIMPIEELDAKLLYYYLKWYNVPSLGYSRHYKLLKELNIPLPPLPIQRRIVEELDEINAIISAKKQQLSKLDELAQSIFYTMFGDPVANEKGWEVKTLGEAVAPSCTISYGIVQPGDGVEEGIPVVRPVDLTETYIKKGNLKKTTQEISDSYSRTLLTGEEILVCVRGTTGLSALASKELEGCNVTRGITPLLFDSNNKWFMFFQLRTASIMGVISDYTKGITLKQINMGDFRKIKVILPPLPLQETFAARVSAIEDQKAAIAASIEKMQTLLDARMQEYFG